MQKHLMLGIVGLGVILLVGAVLFYSAYYNSFYAIDRANALFSRAETAAFAEDMVMYMQRGERFLPQSGNPVWWFPTDRTDFSEIHKDIGGIISRAVILESLPRNGTAYQQGMTDLRGKVSTLEMQLSQASGFMFVSSYNVIASVVWLAVFAAGVFLVRRR